MNILLYKGWMRINIFNLLKSFDGHYTVFLNQETKQYYFRQFGTYHNLTQYIPFKGEYLKLKPDDERFINEILDDRFNNGYSRITDISDTSLWGSIYDDVMVAIDQLQFADPKYLNTYKNTCYA